MLCHVHKLSRLSLMTVTPELLGLYGLSPCMCAHTPHDVHMITHVIAYGFMSPKSRPFAGAQNGL